MHLNTSEEGVRVSGAGVEAIAVYEYWELNFGPLQE